MFGTSKDSFWQALILTIFVFVIGIVLGIAYEGSKSDQINNYYTLSEISLIDSLAINNLVALNQTSCQTLAEADMSFADRIYQEAFTLEQYEGAGKITDVLNATHRKYDLLRTVLWINSMQTEQKCGKQFSTVVYLYDYNTPDLNQKALQSVWSTILYDLKQAKGNQVLLIPIAVDSDLSSLNSLLENYNITKYPAVIIDNKKVLYNLTTVPDLEKQL